MRSNHWHNYICFGHDDKPHVGRLSHLLNFELGYATIATALVGNNNRFIFIYLWCVISKTVMTIIQLEYLLAVANCGSFSQAAEHCFVTQPSLSMQIKAPVGR